MARSLAGKDIDFLNVLHKKKGPTKASARARASLVILALFALGMGVGFYFYMREYRSIEEQRHKAEAFLLSEAMQTDTLSAREVEDSSLVAERKAQMLRDAIEGLEARSTLTSADLNRIYRLTGSTMLVTELNYDAKAATLTLRLISTDVKELAPFVERLRNDSAVQSILYTGYSAAGMPDYAIAMDESTGETIAAPHVQEETEPPQETVEDAIAAADDAVTEEPSGAFTFEVTAGLKGVESDV